MGFFFLKIMEFTVIANNYNVTYWWQQWNAYSSNQMIRYKGITGEHADVEHLGHRAQAVVPVYTIIQVCLCFYNRILCGMLSQLHIFNSIQYLNFTKISSDLTILSLRKFYINKVVFNTSRTSALLDIYIIIVTFTFGFSWETSRLNSAEKIKPPGRLK